VGIGDLFQRETGFDTVTGDDGISISPVIMP
jgi:hypothetical protein